MSGKGKRKPLSSSILESDDEEGNDDDLEEAFISEESIVKELMAEEESEDVLGELSNSALSNSLNSILCRRPSISENGSTSSYFDSAYDSVSSPGGSSTASGPTYIRTAGFDNHAQEIISTSGASSENASRILSTGDINDPVLSLRGRQFPINKKTSGNILKSSKINSKTIPSSSRKVISSNSSSPNTSSDSSSPFSSASSTSSSTSREPLILRGVKKKKALLLNTSKHKEEAVINAKQENKTTGCGKNRRKTLGSNTPSITQINYQRPKLKKGRKSVIISKSINLNTINSNNH